MTKPNLPPGAPGEVPQQSSAWAFLAFAPAVIVATVLLGFVTDLPSLQVLVSHFRRSPATWVLGYWMISILQAAAFSMHALRSDRLEPGQRVAWVFAFAVASPIAAPLYWLKGLTSVTR
jgi:hypothetical protein